MNQPVHPVIVQKQKELFLETLARTGNVTSAARACGWKYPTIAETYRDQDPDFAFAWRDAQAQAIDALEGEARRRAMEGVQEPVFYKGDLVGTVTKYSDKMLELLLKAERPEKFREMQGGGSAELPGVLVVPRSETDSETKLTEWEKNASAQQRKLLERTE